MAKIKVDDMVARVVEQVSVGEIFVLDPTSNPGYAILRDLEPKLLVYFGPDGEMSHDYDFLHRKVMEMPSVRQRVIRDPMGCVYQIGDRYFQVVDAGPLVQDTLRGRVSCTLYLREINQVAAYRVMAYFRNLKKGGSV